MLIKLINYGTLMLSVPLNGNTIFDFTTNTNFQGWSIVNDDVMGGRSVGSLKLDESGNGVFSGYISLRNYGGFSSIRYRTNPIDVSDAKTIVMRLKGDNKYYQLRIKSKYRDRHVYSKKFFLSDEWQDVTIPIRSMEPQFRGQRLRMNNFNHNTIVEFGILIGNKVEEYFSLQINNLRIE